jgi:hypothetical protein
MGGAFEPTRDEDVFDQDRPEPHQLQPLPGTRFSCMRGGLIFHHTSAAIDVDTGANFATIDSHKVGDLSALASGASYQTKKNEKSSIDAYLDTIQPADSGMDEGASGVQTDTTGLIFERGESKDVDQFLADIDYLLAEVDEVFAAGRAFLWFPTLREGFWCLPTAQKQAHFFPTRFWLMSDFGLRSKLILFLPRFYRKLALHPANRKRLFRAFHALPHLPPGPIADLP